MYKYLKIFAVILAILVFFPAAVLGENATYTVGTGILHIPRVDIPGSNDAYEVDLVNSGGVFYISSIKKLNSAQFLRSEDYSFKRDILGTSQSFGGDYEVYTSYVDITVRNYDYTEAFARWIFGSMLIDGKMYEFVETAEEVTPSQIFAEYLGTITDQYGYDFHKFRLHLPDGVDATFAMTLTPTTLVADEWSPESITF